jgi:hypothetical protein
MTIRLTPIRTASVVLCAIGAIATAAAGTAVAASRAPHRHVTAVSAASLPVVINCAGKGQVKPGSYILACADGNAFITKMRWASWAGQAAFGSGTETFRVCVPNCVSGKTVSVPVLAALWRVQTLPGHRRTHYFTRLTLIYTGNRTYQAGGKKFHLPQTVTDPLSAFGGA